MACVCFYHFFLLKQLRHYKIKNIYMNTNFFSTTTMSARVKRHAKVSGPKWFVHGRKV